MDDDDDCMDGWMDDEWMDRMMMRDEWMDDDGFSWLQEKEEMEELLDSSAHDLEESKSRILHLQELQKDRTRTKSQYAK